MQKSARGFDIVKNAKDFIDVVFKILDASEIDDKGFKTRAHHAKMRQKFIYNIDVVVNF